MASICRLCLTSSSEEQFRSMSSVNQEELIIILPEIDVHIVQSPLICTDCEKCLSQAYSFKSTCLKTEKRIATYADTYGENIDLNNLLSSQVCFESKPDLTELDMKGTFSLTTSIDIKQEDPDVDDNSNNDLLKCTNDNIDEIKPLILQRHSIKLCCEICFKKFKTKRALTFHKKSHFSRYQCPSCAKLFRQAGSLRKHVRRFHPEFKRNITSEIKCSKYGIEIENCPKCGKENCECPERPPRTCPRLRYKCKTCGKLFRFIYLLQRHQIVHQTEKKHVCKICKKGFVCASYLERHINIRHAGKYEQISCATCGKLLLDEFSLKRHIQAFHSTIKTTSTKICEICDKEFTKLASYRRHMLTHNETPEFICETCNEKFTTKFCLQKHINTDHFDKRELIKYICEFCDLEFLRRHEYHDHKKETHPTDGKTYACEICGISCNVKANLDIHMRIHTGERPYKCDECGQCFRQVGSMNVHKRAKHSEVKPFPCQYCDKSFAWKGVWTKHLERVHKVGVTEKKFACTFCPKAFHVQNELTRHVKWHTGERNFICDVCNKGFINNPALKKHKLIHDKKLHVCDACGKSFYQKCHLNRHKKVHDEEHMVTTVKQVKLESNDFLLQSPSFVLPNENDS